MGPHGTLGAMLHPGLSLDLTVDRLAYGGQGVARHEGFVVFVRGAVPGDRVRATIVKRKPRYAEARLDEVLSASPLRRGAACGHVGDCGGCEWQTLDYAAQLELKQSQVLEALEHIGHLTDFDVEPIQGMEHPWGYRNKMEYSFGEDDDGRLLLGLHRRGSWRDIVELDQCRLAPPEIEAARAAVAEACRALGLRAYRRAAGRPRRRRPDAAPDGPPATQAGAPEDHDALGSPSADAREADAGTGHDAGPEPDGGPLRHLSVRHGRTSGDLLLNLFVSGRFPEEQALLDRVRAACRFNSFGITVNEAPADAAIGIGPFMLEGPPFLRETLAGVPLHVPAMAFLQTNTLMCSRLYDTALRFAEPDPSRPAFDLYCGIGSLTLPLARRSASVTGIETQEEAIDAARENARRNAITNVSFQAADVRVALKWMLPLPEAERPAVVLTDPPRAGMSRKAVQRMAALGAERIVYVSCNPATLAGNAAELAELGYRLRRVAPVDMFPHTHHIETVALFEAT
jgi:23S rRNA (uracil1939-C5)-methyltransferase